jgi:hypothetical protein
MQGYALGWGHPKPKGYKVFSELFMEWVSHFDDRKALAIIPGL